MNKFGNFLIHSLNTFLGTKAFDGTETEDEAAAKLESFKAPVAQEQEAAIADLTARLTALEAAAPVNTADFASVQAIETLTESVIEAATRLEQLETRANGMATTEAVTAVTTELNALREAVKTMGTPKPEGQGGGVSFPTPVALNSFKVKQHEPVTPTNL